LILAVHVRSALFGRVTTAGQAHRIMVACHQSLSYCEDAPLALDKMGKVICRAPT
jgi:hypothetical protein